MGAKNSIKAVWIDQNINNQENKNYRTKLSQIIGLSIKPYDNTINALETLEKENDAEAADILNKIRIKYEKMKNEYWFVLIIQIEKLKKLTKKIIFSNYQNTKIK